MVPSYVGNCPFSPTCTERALAYTIAATAVPEGGIVVGTTLWEPDDRRSDGRTSMASRLRLPQADGRLVPYIPGPPGVFALPSAPFRSRVAYAAAHVVCDPLADADPMTEATIDWEATLRYRHYLWSLGLSVAEAMD